MKKIVIVGAGPIGLYLALKLHKQGVKNIVIYDPRAGEYTRPGHINQTVFNLLEDRLSEKFWFKKHGHIKDVERILFERVKKHQIPIEKKRFIGFNTNESKPGIIVVDKEDKNEVIECDYAFDCTGTKRELIHKVNETVKDQPFKLTPISSVVPIKNNFIAYVEMTTDDLNWVEFGPFSSNSSYLQNATALQYAKSIEKLRQLGWSEFTIPKCYGMPFGKGKVCVYMECPDNLPKQSYETWMQTVLDCKSGKKNIQFKQLPTSKKHPNKPRFNSFIVDPMELNQVSYQSKGLPMVIAIGDAQRDPYYVLAHGIESGIESVDQLLKSVKIEQNDIIEFNESNYLLNLSKIQFTHNQEIIKQYKGRSSDCVKMTRNAEILYSQAINQTSNELQKNQFRATLKEIKARNKYNEGTQKLSLICNKNGQINIEEHNPKQLISQLIEITELLDYALAKLPQSFTIERTEAFNKLLILIDVWKKISTKYINKEQIEIGIRPFEQRISDYKNTLFHSKQLNIDENKDENTSNLKNKY